jgi:hypothetical protein
MVKLRIANTTLQCFASEPHTDCWKYLNPHAQRVRHLTYQNTHARSHTVGVPLAAFTEDVWAKVSRLCPLLPILPNLIELSFTGNNTSGDEIIRNIHLFLHKGLRILKFSAPEATEVFIAPILTCILKKAPHLRELTIETVLRDLEIDTDLDHQLASAISQMHALQYVSLPSLLLTPKVLGALSRLPSLEDMFSLDGFPFSCWTDENAISPTRFAFEVGGFCALRNLELYMNLADFIWHMDRRQIPANLGFLSLLNPDFLPVPQPQQWRAFFIGLPAALPSITELRLQYQYGAYSEALTIGPRLSWSDLSPLRELANLESLDFRYDYVELLTVVTLAEFAHTCPHLTSLSLRSGCVDKEGEVVDPTLVPEDLLVLAVGCPHLECISMCLDLHLSDQDSTLQEPGLDNSLVFLKAMTLELVCTTTDLTATHIPIMANRLHRIFPKGCELTKHSTYLNFDDGTEKEAGIEEINSRLSHLSKLDFRMES